MTNIHPSKAAGHRMTSNRLSKATGFRRPWGNNLPVMRLSRLRRETTTVKEATTDSRPRAKTRVEVSTGTSRGQVVRGDSRPMTANDIGCGAITAAARGTPSSDGIRSVSGIGGTAEALPGVNSTRTDYANETGNAARHGENVVTSMYIDGPTLVKSSFQVPYNKYVAWPYDRPILNGGHK